MANDRYLLPLSRCGDLMNLARRLRLGKSGLLPSTVILLTGYQKGEDYAKTFLAL